MFKDHLLLLADINVVIQAAKAMPAIPGKKGLLPKYFYSAFDPLEVL